MGLSFVVPARNTLKISRWPPRGGPLRRPQMPPLQGDAHTHRLDAQGLPRCPRNLLRRTEWPNVFISYGPWPDRDTVARWRSSDDFKSHLLAISETLERFEPLLLEHLATKR